MGNSSARHQIKKIQKLLQLRRLKKKIADLEAFIKELKAVKGHDETPEDLLKSLHPKDFKSPT